MSLDKLPPELLTKVFSYLSGREIANLSQTCISVHEVSLIEDVWRERCWKDYGVKVTSSARLVYQKILHNYGKLLDSEGIWRLDIGHFGALIQVKFDAKTNRLIGAEWKCSSSVDAAAKMTIRKVFHVCLAKDENMPANTMCTFSSSHTHPCTLSQEHFDEGIVSWKFLCCFPMFHSKKDLPLNGTAFFKNAQQERDKLLKSLNWCYKLLPLESVTSRSICPNKMIAPGFFRARYGVWHGIEIQRLYYSEDGTEAKCLKVTGDPNVPAGELTFHADLKKPLFLSLEEQETMSSLVEAQAVEQSYEELPPQPFKIPEHCDNGRRSFPKTCIARFKGRGHYADDGFTDDRFTDGHWIIFNQDLMAFTWLEFEFFITFHRIPDL